jgi:hypothetical protein
MPATRERFAAKIAAIAIKAIEHCEILPNVAALKELEARDPFRVERHHLAVQ